MKLLHLWFAYTGRIKTLDFWLKGFAPGILLGVLAIRLDAAFDARGLIWYPFFAFSLWPLSALLVKLWHNRDRSGTDSCA